MFSTPDDDHQAQGAGDDPDATPVRPAGTGSGTSRFVRGLRVGFPILLGYVPVGAAFGVLARGVGFSVLETALCSALVFAGAGQFIAVSLLGSGAGAVSVLIATTVVNLRHILFATTLSTRVKDASFPLLGWLGFSMTDETFAVNIADLRQGLGTPQSMAGVGLIAWSGWLAGSVIGATAAGWIGDPDRLGLNFAMAAMFSALFVALAENRQHVLVGILSAGLVLITAAAGPSSLPQSWHVVIASIVSATVAAAVTQDA